MAYKKVKVESKHGKMVLPNAPGPVRKYYCPAHETVMTPVKEYGNKTTLFECKEGCRVSKSFAIKK